MKQNQNEIDFFFELRVLLDRYDVDIVATDDGEPYGQQSPLLQFEFNRPYGCYEFTSVSSADEPDQDGQSKTG